MEFKKRSDRIWLEDQQGNEIAYVSFCDRGDHVAIISTVVDPSLRGQGIAEKLLDALAEELRRTGRKAYPVCSYAVKWFSTHPAQADLLAEDD